MARVQRIPRIIYTCHNNGPFFQTPSSSLSPLENPLLFLKKLPADLIRANTAEKGSVEAFVPTSNRCLLKEGSYFFKRILLLPLRLSAHLGSVSEPKKNAPFDLESLRHPPLTFSPLLGTLNLLKHLQKRLFTV